MLWAHGSKDDVIAFSCQAAGAAVMRDAGVPVTSKDYDMGHDTSESEFADVLQVRRRVVRCGSGVTCNFPAVHPISHGPARLILLLDMRSQASGCDLVRATTRSINF
jgi:hypothetical protein